MKLRTLLTLTLATITSTAWAGNSYLSAGYSEVGDQAATKYSFGSQGKIFGSEMHYTDMNENSDQYKVGATVMAGYTFNVADINLKPYAYASLEGTETLREDWVPVYGYGAGAYASWKFIYADLRVGNSEVDYSSLDAVSESGRSLEGTEATFSVGFTW